MVTIQPFGFFLLRQHTLPIDNLFKLNEFCSNFIEAEIFLKKIFEQSTFREAIFIASPSLYNRFLAWQNGENISEKSKLILTLFKYYLRMSSRCTPYGTFAGCALGEIGQETKIVQNSQQPLRIHQRLDTNYLVEIVNFLLLQEDIRRQIKFYLNNTIYQVGNKYHYLFYTLQEQNRSYSICSIEVNEYVQLVIEKAQKGVYLDEIIDLLAIDSITTDDAKEFIEQMISEQILFSEIEPTISGDNFLSILLEKLSTLSINENILKPLQRIHCLLQQDNCSIEQYQQVETILKMLLGSTNTNFLQTVSYHNYISNTIDKQIINNLNRQFEKLLVLNHGNYNEDLDKFKKRFYARYEDAEIPLALALDNEVGIGYGNQTNLTGNSHLLVDIPTENPSSPKVINWIFWKEFSTQKYIEAIKNQAFEICLSDQDLNQIKAKHTEYLKFFPSTFNVFGSLFEHQNQPHFQLKSMSGPSAISMMARFAIGDEQLTQKLRESVDYEHQQDKDAIFAEIVHIPEARVGNISARPRLREYEIPYQTPSILPIENQIQLDDIMVSVVGGNSIVLRSKKQNKQIIPRLSSAHDYRKGLSIYRFLCDLQYETEVFNIAWHWHILSSHEFLPRVRYQNVILSPATWNISTAQFDKHNLCIEQLSNFVKRLKIPRYTLIADGDNELFIDLENEICLGILKETIQKNEIVTLKEVLVNPENCFLKSLLGCFTNEMIIPYKTINYKPHKTIQDKQKKGIERDFSVGSEWIYFKIYCGEKKGDDLLINEIRCLCNELLSEQIINQCFFIRYRDPDFHIRLRFKGDPNTLFYAHIIKRVHDILTPAQEANMVYKIQIDTYSRELERYGENTIELSEELFFRDSLTILNFLNQNSDENERLLFAFKRIDYMLNILIIDDKRGFTEKMQRSFIEEFGDTTELKKKLNEKYRHQIQISNIFDSNFYFTDLDQVAHQILNKTSQVHDRQRLLSSYIHMLINRLFISNNRIYELLIYHFLYKSYTTISMNVK